MNDRNWRVSSGPKERQEENQHLWKVFRNNGYPVRILKRHLQIETDPIQQARAAKEEPIRTWAVPYLQGTTEKLKRIAKRYGFTTYVRSGTSLRSSICKPKDKLSKDQTAGVIYNFSCGCGKHYIGESGRPVSLRMKEHKKALKDRDPENAMALHRLEGCTNINPPEPSEAKLLRTGERFTRERKIKEGLLIKAHGRNLVNGNEGQFPSQAFLAFGSVIAASHRL